METSALPLAIESTNSTRVWINDSVSFDDFEGTRAVLLCGELFFHYSIGDRDSEAFLIATLARDGHARVNEIARAFGVDVKTVYRYRRRLEEGGLRSIFEKKRGPKGAFKLDRALRGRVLALKNEGLSNRAVARRLGIAANSVGRILREEGYEPPEPPRLPGTEPAGPVEEAALVAVDERAAAEALDALGKADVAPCHDGDPVLVAEPASSAARPVAEATPLRLEERALAPTGELVEAVPVLVSGENLRGLGLLLALPCLVEVGILSAVKKVYGSLRPGFYGLRSFVLTLLFLALFRIKRPEGTKGIAPEVLGRLLGLDRAPEVKTLRRKLTEVAGREQSGELVAEIARRIREDDEELVGFLYIDGHVRAYHGKRTLPKTWVARRRMCLPATTDYWVNDAEGGPFFFVTTEGNPGLSKVLPDLLAEVKEILGDRRATVIFDRGGWSQKTLRKIVRMGFDFITYRRRPYDDLPEDAFTTCEVDGVEVDLAEGTAEYKQLGRVRIVAKKDPDGKQVHIVTNLEKEQLDTAEVYWRMTRRWRQENFFRYMRQEYGLDDVLSYEMVPADPERLVPNPKWKEEDRRVRQQRAKVNGLEQKLGAGSKEPKEGNRPTLMAFKAAVVETAAELIAAEEELARRIELRKAVPKRVPLGQALEEPPMRLEFERKVFTDALKIAAYRAETALANAIAPDYRRAHDEARKLVEEAYHASGDLEVDDKSVTVRLEPLSSPHRTLVLQKLCAILSDKNVMYPGTDLRLRYELRPGADRAPWGRGACQEP